MLSIPSVDERLSWGLVLVGQTLGSVSLFNKIPSPYWKHWASILITLVTMGGMLDRMGTCQILLLSVLSYYVIKSNRYAFWMPVVVIILCLVVLVLNHILLLWETGSSTVLNYSIPMLTCIMKIISFGWSVYDGHANQRPTLLQRSRSIKEEDVFPALEEYVGYLLFFPSFLIGPFFDYPSYHDCIHREVREKSF
jgi:lysophospholipid acyltransferase